MASIAGRMAHCTTGCVAGSSGSRVSNDGVIRWSNGAAQLAARLLVMVFRTEHAAFSELLGIDEGVDCFLIQGFVEVADGAPASVFPSEIDEHVVFPRRARARRRCSSSSSSH
ncbi:uncharacterized protein LOC125477082 [Pyrus x bretschneideri]|uniref:uncharacterized protein LOC125477082 n=1 Tax=Pyrus x bretschneideri TaxID=225117 RepID=UPI00202DE069|nr:uncharacterized protein LOC125477082 [Pyrus x bretschneideri]